MIFAVSCATFPSKVYWSLLPFFIVFSRLNLRWKEGNFVLFEGSILIILAHWDPQVLWPLNRMAVSGSWIGSLGSCMRSRASTQTHLLVGVSSRCIIPYVYPFVKVSGRYGGKWFRTILSIAVISLEQRPDWRPVAVRNSLLILERAGCELLSLSWKVDETRDFEHTSVDPIRVNDSSN